MNWRPEGLKNPFPDKHTHYYEIEEPCECCLYDGFEAGADAILEALKPLLTTIHAQLCGIRMREGKASWYSALDNSIDSIGRILNKEVKDD